MFCVVESGYPSEIFDVILIFKMKTRILLIDESLTVQKVVSLTLEKSAYQVQFALNRKEAGRIIVENTPHLILVSDQVKDLNASTFPKEVESWLGRNHDLPAMILITAQDIKEIRHYVGVLRKPFAPQVLKSMVDAHTGAVQQHEAPNEFEEERLEKAFLKKFNDEEELVHQTFATEAPPERTSSSIPLLNVEESVAYKSTLENQVKNTLEGRDLDAVVDRLLDKILPPIVERLVHERLDALLKEQERPSGDLR